MVNGKILPANQHLKNSNETPLKMRGLHSQESKVGLICILGLQIIQETTFNLPAASTTLTQCSSTDEMICAAPMT